MDLSAEHVDLSSIRFTPELIGTVPAKVARNCQVLPLYERDDALCVAVGYPADLDAIDTVLQQLGRPVEFRYADPGQLRTFIGRLYAEHT